MWGSSLVNEQEERPWTNGAAANVASMSLGTGIIAAADERWWSEAVYTSLIGLVTRTAEAEIAEIEANLSPAYRAYKVRRLESAAADGVPDSIPHKPPINAPTYCSAAADRRASAAVRATADASSIVAFIDNTAGQAALSKGYGKDPAANVKAFGDLGFATTAATDELRTTAQLRSCPRTVDVLAELLTEPPDRVSELACSTRSAADKVPEQPGSHFGWVNAWMIGWMGEWVSG
ncbi:unnamed protein product [Symbiodinium sp. KB8]|nr:unnamed protein product [Symbiodinium sp. KB8]